MQWNSQSWFSPVYKTLVLLGPILLLIGIYREITFLFATGMLILILYASTYFQFRSAEKDLVLDTTKQVYRLFPGDTENLFMKISHKGKWPAYRGELSFTHRDTIGEKDIEHEEGTHGRVLITRPFAIYKQTAYTEHVPFTAKRRGTTRISNVTLRLKDPFQTGSVLLNYQLLFPAEFIIYPEPLPVYRIEHLFHQGYGENVRPFALYENESRPAGNRDYMPGDSFHKLHWKATAKTGTLQTKVYEKTVVFHWTFVYTIQPEHNKVSMKTTEEIEREISYLAYMCQFASEKGIPFEVYINFKVPGPLGLYHVESGSGSHHLSKVLEGLARIDRSSVTVKPLLLWNKVNRNLTGSIPFVILLGHIPTDESVEIITKKWMRAGGKIFRVEQDEMNAYLVPFLQRKEVVS